MTSLVFLPFFSGDIDVRKLEEQKLYRAKFT